MNMQEEVQPVTRIAKRRNKYETDQDGDIIMIDVEYERNILENDYVYDYVDVMDEITLSIFNIIHNTAYILFANVFISSLMFFF